VGIAKQTKSNCLTITVGKFPRNDGAAITTS